MLDKTDDVGPGDDAEALETDAPEFNPALNTLCGDLRDVMLGRIRTTRKPWAQMTEDEQTDLANGVQLAASDMVRRMVRLMSTHKWPHAVVKLCEIKIGGTNGIDIKMTCPNIQENREVLGDHVNTMVQVVMIDSDQFMGETAPVDIRPDQPELQLEDGDGFPDQTDAELPLEDPAPGDEPANTPAVADLE